MSMKFGLENEMCLITLTTKNQYYLWVNKWRNPRKRPYLSTSSKKCKIFMGSFHWSRTSKPSKSIFPVSYEWEMNCFSPILNQNLQGPAGVAEEKGSPDPEKNHEEDRARCDWDISLATVVATTSVGAGSDTLGVTEFDPTGSILATGGIARKIRIYTLNSLLPHRETFFGENPGVSLLDHDKACSFYICTPAKLSSLRWRPGENGRVLGSGDYDGVVTEYDLDRKTPVFERDEHGGRRVWSVDYSIFDPILGASGSDDGTVQMWDPRCESGECVAMVQPSVAGSPVCCVEFNPFGGSILAVGCADRKAYAYDIRKMVDPIKIFDGHRKTVTYIRFLDHCMLISASTDGCLKLWDLENSNAIRTYEGHVNNRSFVGLSVWRNGGLIGCGSENNQVFVYDKRWGERIWVHEFEAAGASSSSHEFVSSVCWRQVGVDEGTLVAGGSDGVLQVFVGKRKPI